MTTQLLLGLAPDWVPTLENFVTGRNLELLATLRQADARQGDTVIIWVALKVLAVLNLICPLKSVLEISRGQLHADSQGAEFLAEFNRPGLPMQPGFEFLHHLHCRGIIPFRPQDVCQG